ncbi:MAG: menaquinone biosynthesis protein [Candidatus Eremiobacteraeota bacterium]|nr:menaquinone biosynthesis protein [Candidatus Eremiobacteraeota bacterium]
MTGRLPKKTSSLLKCGRIEYTNDLPIYAAFDAGAIAYPGSLHADVPATLNAMLVNGKLDLSPISAFAYAQHASDLVLLPDLCIGARDRVISVILVSPTPPALLDGAKIFVTAESASGRNLLRILLERRYGVHAEFIETADPSTHARNGNPTLLIGDRAIDALLSLPPEHIYDLGTLWHDFTGEQTVFAVWAARKAAYAAHPQEVRACMHALTDSYTWGRGNMSTVVKAANTICARPDGFYENYYAQLNFTLHSAAQSGLAAYYRELLAIGAIDRLPPSIPEVIGVSA